MSQPVQGMGGALAPNFLTQKQEAIAITAVSVASGVYILKSLPLLFLPQGVFTLLVSLLLGLFFGLILSGCVLYYLFYRFTHPKPPQSIPSPSTNPSLPTNSTATTATGNSIPTRDVTRPSATMPHAYTSHGEFHGVIFTVTQSHWDRTSCVLDWPPSTTPGFKTWQASLRQGTLVLTPLPRHHHHLQDKNSGTERNGNKKKKKKKRNQEDAENLLEHQQKGEQHFKVDETRATDALQAEIQQQQQQIGIPLEGCTIELVRDGLDGRSEMVRRAPLLLSHTSWPLLDGDKKVFLFATDPAAKQEWLTALSYWCVNSSGDAFEGSIKSIEETYQLFCSMMAQKSTLPSVQERFPNSSSSLIDTTLNTSTGSGSREGGGGVLEVGIRGVNGGAVEAETSSLARRSIDQGGAGAGDERGGGGEANEKCVNKQISGKKTSWKRWRKSKREGQGGEIENEEIEQGADDDVVETLLLPPPPQGATATGAGTAVGEVRAPVEVEPHAATAEDIDSIIEMRWMQSRKVPVPPAPPKQKHQERNSGGGGGLSNVPSTASSLTASPSLSPVKVPPIGPVVYRQVLPPSQLQQQEQQQAGTAGVGPSTTATPSGSAQASPTKRQQPPSTTHHQSSLPPQPSRLLPGFPSPLLPFDFFINATATRACFDLLRNPAFSEHVRARIQRQLSRMHTPDYVTSLEVVSVDPGCIAPTLSKFAAVPQPAMHAVFPQLIFDMKYSGSFTVTIECKVDIRDAAAWSALDHAIDRIEGKKKIIKTHHHQNINKKERVMEEEGEDEDEEADILGDRDSVSDEDDVDNNDDENGDIYDEEELLHPSSRSDSGSSSPSRSIAESPKSDAGPSTTESEYQNPPKRRLLGQLRQKTANKLRKLADSTATRISNLPLRVSLTFSVLEGTMCVWIPPPPGDRLFWSFLSPPKLSLKATPQIGQRVLKYAYHASRASEWIQARLELAFRKNLVFPCGGDIALPLLLPVWNPRAFDGLDGLEKEQTAAATAAALGVNAARAGARNASSHGRPPIQVTKQEERNRENGVSVTRVLREDTNGIAGSNSTTASGGGTSAAAAAASAAPFVEFSLRRPPRNNTSE